MELILSHLRHVIRVTRPPLLTLVKAIAYTLRPPRRPLPFFIGVNEVHVAFQDLVRLT